MIYVVAGTPGSVQDSGALVKERMNLVLRYRIIERYYRTYLDFILRVIDPFLQLRTRHLMLNGRLKPPPKPRRYAEMLRYVSDDETDG